MPIATDLTTLKGRVQLIEQIAWSENVKRKALSLRQTEIYGDYLFNHVWDNIAGRFSPETARTMPVCAHINLARRIVKAEASIYKEEPRRTFTDATPEQEEVLRLVYREMMANSKFMRSNESFKLQQQNHVMIVPKDGKLKMRVLRNHHIDKIDDPTDPEVAAGYVIHSFDRSFFDENRRRDNDSQSYGQLNQYASQRSDGINAVIGDEEDWKTEENRYLIWTKELNFIMDGKGNILTDTIDSPIPGILPIVDISQEKDFTYWVNQGDAIVDATLDYNVTMSDIGYIVQNQGFAQAYLIAEKGMIPDNLQIGPNSLLHLPIDMSSDQRPEFGFAQPGSDIAGALAYASDKLMAFLTSRGLDPDTITTDSGLAGSSSSGVQEFLRMMKHFKASKEDYDTYKRAEMQVYDIVKAWNNQAPQLLGDKFKTSQLSEDSELQIQYAGPEMLQTEQEKIDVWASKLEHGFASRVDAIMAIEGLDKDAAVDRIMEIDKDGDYESKRADNKESKIEPIGIEPGTEEES